MFCSKCGDKLNHGEKSCNGCGSPIEALNGKSKLDVYVDEVVGNAVKSSFNGQKNGNTGIPAWFLYGIFIVVFILLFYLSKFDLFSL